MLSVEVNHKVGMVLHDKVACIHVECSLKV